jgi:hypothetical protein
VTTAVFPETLSFTSHSCACVAAAVLLLHSSMLAVLVVLDTLLAWPSSTPRLLLHLPC